MFKRFLFFSISFLTLVFPFSVYSKTVGLGCGSFVCDSELGSNHFPRDVINEFDKIQGWMPKLSKYCSALVSYAGTVSSTSINYHGLPGIRNPYVDVNLKKFDPWYPIYDGNRGSILVYYDFSAKNWVASNEIDFSQFYKNGYIDQSLFNYGHTTFTGSTALIAFNKFIDKVVSAQNNIYSTVQTYYDSQYRSPYFPIEKGQINTGRDLYALFVPKLLTQIKLHIHNRSNLPYPIRGGNIYASFKCPAAP